ncbi:uncharacterized protein LOC141899788 [Tubulanus polymorphus]|uniref:uncharacterized protein LOC141899788 n=1 Tax=Tubulanus polymorphus TaxID=672921 RepID=UPI003DA2E500
MFPSAGYFKGLLCPYYLSGLCERPYCHFKHYKPDPDQSGETTVNNKAANKLGKVQGLDEKDGNTELYTPSAVQPRSSMLSMVGKAIKNVEKEIEKDKYRLQGRNSSATSCIETSKKTRITLADSPAVAVDDDEDDDNNDDDDDMLPATEYEYVPTKIRPKPMEYTPTPLNVLKNSAKYSSTAATSDVDEHEYDPTCNFKATPSDSNKLTYRSTNASSFQYFNDDDENDDDRGGYNDDGARFSDEDEDEDLPSRYRMSNYKVSRPLDEDVHDEDDYDDSTNGNGDDLVSQILNASKAPPKISTEKTGFINSDDEVLSANKARTSTKPKVKKEKSLKKVTTENVSKRGGQFSSEANRKRDGKTLIESHQKLDRLSTKLKSSNSGESKISKEPKSSGKSSSLVASESKHQRNQRDSERSESMSKSKHDSKRPKEYESKNSVHSSRSSSKTYESKKTDRMSGSSKTHDSMSSDYFNQSSKTHESKKSDFLSKSSSHNGKHESGSSKSSSRSSLHHEASKRTKTSSSSERSSGKSEQSPKGHLTYDKKSRNGKTILKSSNENLKSSESLKRREFKTSPAKKNRAISKIEEGSEYDSPSPKKQKTASSKVDLFGADSDSDSGSSVVSNLFSDFESYQKLKLATSSPVHIASSPSHHTSEDNDASDCQTFDISDEEIMDEDDHYEECLQIFNEEQKQVKKASVSRPVPVASKSKEFENFLERKRMSHMKGIVPIQRKPAPKLQRLPTPLTVMQNRLLSLQEKSKSLPTKTNLTGGSLRGASGNSSRIKKRDMNHRSSAHDTIDISDEEEMPTPCQTASKKARTAHVPKKKIIKRPIIPPDPASKVPTNVRMRYLNLLIDECLKTYDQEQDAHNRAVAEEKIIFERSASKGTYLNVAANTIKKLRNEQQQQHQQQSSSDSSPQSSKRSKFSHAALLDGSKAASVSYTVHRSNSRRAADIILTDVDVYKKFLDYALTVEQMRDNGYPLPDPKQPGVAIIKKKYSAIAGLKTHEKICSRCGASFIVYPNGVYQNKEECIYHWGRAWKSRESGSWETRYTCCQSDLSVKGCSISKLHVHDMNRTEDVKGFMRTIPSSPSEDGNYGFYSLDCEMVYTSKGSELARITVIDRELQTVYDSLVQPEKPVVDYNTRFSGLTEKDLMDVTTTLRDVQAVLLSLFNTQTILIGHSLESDLIALKLMHACVVDTSVVFPHRLGAPYKRALRTLMAEILNKIIQNDVGGHNSNEDAAACMELMLWKIKDDMKKYRN